MGILNEFMSKICVLDVLGLRLHTVTHAQSLGPASYVPNLMQINKNDRNELGKNINRLTARWRGSCIVMGRFVTTVFEI